MNYKLICCEVFTREACLAIAQSKNTVDVEFTPKAAHENAATLNTLIQSKIDIAESENKYDAILLGFGLCGNSTLGLKSKNIPIVIPRAHDCCTLFLGSKKKFLKYFEENFSKEWSSSGYLERGDSYIRDTDTGNLLGFDKNYEDFVKEYGEDNAQFLWESLHPKNHDTELIYIDVKEASASGSLEKFKKFAEEEKKTVRIIDGDMRLIRALIDGTWNEDEFLVVPPNSEIKSAYDHEEVIKF